MAYGHVLVGQYSFRIRSSISSTIVSLCDKEYLKIRFFIVLCSTFSGGLDVISGVNDFLISGKKGKKTSSSQTRKVSTSDLQLVLLEVLSLLFNTPPDLEVSGLSKWPRAVHLFIALLFSLLISRVPHLEDPPPLLQHLDGVQHHSYLQSCYIHESIRRLQVCWLFQIIPRIPLQ